MKYKGSSIAAAEYSSKDAFERFLSIMASSSGSAYSAAREPEEGEWEALRTLDDILAWARIGGAMDYVPSQRGSLLIAAGGGVDTTIEEFAAIPTDNYMHIMENLWMYSASKEPGDSWSQDMTTAPSEMIKARGISAHHVARIWVGAETSRAQKCRRINYTDTKDQEYRDAKLSALQATASSSHSARPSFTEVGETVPINEVADTTQKREIPVMAMEKYRGFYKNYKKWTHVDPKPSITPTRAQLSVLLAILASDSCYVDMGELPRSFRQGHAM